MRRRLNYIVDRRKRTGPDPETTVVARDAHRAELREAISRGLTGRY
jgi:hypothetical protein